MSDPYGLCPEKNSGMMWMPWRGLRWAIPIVVLQVLQQPRVGVVLGGGCCCRIKLGNFTVYCSAAAMKKTALTCFSYFRHPICRHIPCISFLFSGCIIAWTVKKSSNTAILSPTININSMSTFNMPLSFSKLIIAWAVKKSPSPPPTATLPPMANNAPPTESP